MRDFCEQMKEQSIISPGSVGEVGSDSSLRYIAEKLQRCTDAALVQEMTEAMAGADEITLNADEPKGINRVGLRFTFIDSDFRIRRLFWKLVPLERLVETLADGSTRVFKPKTAKAIWTTIKAELQVAGVVDKASMFVPDGA